ncbi:anti-sigma-F factor Fin [Ectobacillus ponti]|uniref:Anti-sigma-F factor Fin family protein n=1 Tax=Ectobacillus ponti TaxID=2961894 RepID=A0AA41XD59_9BACI|nr:anti-sigma-F factor Fin [Ectobacillus ponti]MCP8971179.1 anti-sigma-F factor Fin family protein [Ectobacillus ponti]
MNTHYYCRHCGCKIGSVEQETHQSILAHLTQEEMIQMTHFNEDGDLHVQAICESCEEALQQNPQYHEYENFLQ